ncbi:Lethal(2) giant larvae protein SRO7 [Podospora fimiseda]|uniref:Lethal(2) giant larvae protein SRO7 n=1 Tax=Podospora fimiseda TaxID=252190 RepID=A0AAN7H4R7_9PEZI|nr:Lethal(2) giant larvae protein SRO7 [Podospora fimiseda]
MSSFLRSKQSGIPTSLSSNIPPTLFNPDEQSRHGINSQISCISYDPVQSLLAIGTCPSPFSPSGKIYVFGSPTSRITRTFIPTKPNTAIKQLSFVANRLVSLDSNNDLCIWDLNTGELVSKYTYTKVVSLVTDPGLDWAFVGVQTGEIYVYDLDRERPGNFRLQNFWREIDPRSIGVGIVSVQLHPRDIGKLLIGYTAGIVVYSFKQGVVQRWFALQKERKKLINAVWHPNGTFVVLVYEDGSLVFWDPKEEKNGKVVAERKLEISGGGNIGRIKWCCKGGNMDDTGLLIACGDGLVWIELGLTPVYATSSWEVLREFFEGKKAGIKRLEIPPGAKIGDYCLIPRHSPYFDGAMDPICVLVVLTSGEVLTMSFPSGYPISPTNFLSVDLSFVCPFVQKIGVASIPRERWLGMVEKRNEGEKILKGGMPSDKRRRKMVDVRNVMVVAHADSTIRIWDVGYGVGDEIENAGQLQVDVARSLGRFDDVKITALHMADWTGELAVGTSAGEVVIYKWNMNRSYGRDETKSLDPNPGGLTDISSRAEPGLKEGLQPFRLYEMMQGPISVVACSDVGFVAVGSEGGFFGIVDFRGPTVIHQGPMSEFIKEEKRGGFLSKHSSRGSQGLEFPTAVSFGVMTLEGDGYSSLACFVGTNMGHVATFRLLPSGQGYTAKFAGVAKAGSDKVIAICPVNVDNGQAAAATGYAVAGLREGRQVNGVLVVVTQTEVKIFKPATAKGPSKSFDDQFCDAAQVVELPHLGTAIVCLFGDATTRAYSIPALKEIGRASLSMLDKTRTMSGVISKTGEIFGWRGPSEISVFPVFGSGRALPPSEDLLVNPTIPIPPRPTISNLQWISGTQHISPTDLDLLIGGEGRPPSKRMMDASEAERSGAGSSSTNRGGGGQQEGWGEYLSRQLNERTEKLTFVDDAMMKLQEASQGWADDVNKQVKKQKKEMLLGGLKKTFF